MADIRIKDITTTASSTASGDFFVIDGTTGTRKVNAFNPTFGGNATVTGTLTVNTSGSVFNTRLFINSAARNQTLTDGTAITGSNSADDLALRNDSGKIYLSAGGAVPQFTLTTTALTLSSTTASTTTSTGALVVGNGTSGGLGVGGAINAGNNIVSTIASAPNGSEFTGLQTKIGADGSLGPCLVHVGALPSATGGSRYGYVTCYDTGDWRKLYLGGSPGVGPSGGQVLIPATLSSTSTSSGALVVSGGVGVAEQIHAKYYTATSNIVAGFTANTHVLDYYSGTARNVVFGPDASTIGNWKLQLLRSDASASIDALTVSNAGNGVFYGSVKTAAPSGGTSAAWKLGTVATVSPTSPNRTIEVDIGGTIYYIHAKTTNN